MSLLAPLWRAEQAQNRRRVIRLAVRGTCAGTNGAARLHPATSRASQCSNEDDALLLPLRAAQMLAGNLTPSPASKSPPAPAPKTPSPASDPDTLSPKQRDLWYCRPYANSIAYQIQEAIPNSTAQQVRKVEQSEGTVLSRISGLMWLISAAALLAAGFAVSAAMATAVLERRSEIGLMRSLGAGKLRRRRPLLHRVRPPRHRRRPPRLRRRQLLAWALGRSIFPNRAHAPLQPRPAPGHRRPRRRRSDSRQHPGHPLRPQRQPQPNPPHQRLADRAPFITVSS